MAGSPSSSGGVWMFFVLAMTPILIALILPTLPEFVTRLESIKFGGFEATLHSERLAAGAGATALISERSAGDGYSEIASWANFGPTLETQALVAAQLNAEQQSLARIGDYQKMHRWLIEPVVTVIGCQSRLGMGTLRLKALLGDLIVVLRSEGGIAPPILGPRASTNSPPRRNGALLSLEETLKSLASIQEVPATEHDAQCQAGLANLQLAAGSMSYSLTDDVPPGMLKFSDSGYLTMFLAALMPLEGDVQGRTASLALMEDLLRRDDDAHFLSPFERLNLLFLFGRGMRQSRWEAAQVLAAFNEALDVAHRLRKETLRASERCRHQREIGTPDALACTDEMQDTLDDYAGYIEDNFRIRIISETIAVYVQYMHEGIPVGVEWLGKIEQWNETLSDTTAQWTPQRSPRNGALSTRDAASATTNAAVASVLLAERQNDLSRPVCANADAAIGTAEDIWRDLAYPGLDEHKSVIAIDIQAPLVLVQKYRSYVRGVCEGAGY